MGTNRRKVIVTAFSRKTKIYCWANRENQLLHWIYIDALTGAAVHPEIYFESENAVLRTSPKKDKFGNRDCYHAYTEFHGSLASSQIPGMTFKTIYSPGSYPQVGYYNSTGREIFSSTIVGKGAPSPAGDYNIVTDSSPDFFRSEYYIGGHHINTLTMELISFNHVNSSPTSDVYIKWRRRVIHTDWAKQDSPYRKDSDIIVGGYSICKYLGTTDASALPSPKQLLTNLYAESSYLMLDHFAPDDIVDRIFENLTIPDVNNIENLKDLKDIKKSLPPIVNLLRKRSFKSLAEFYLWYKYSYSTTKLDLEAYYNFFVKWANEAKSKSNSKRTNLLFSSSKERGTSLLTETTRWQIRTNNFNCGVFKALGIDLNLGNTWDLIPFSFVADWFVNIGDILQRIDHYNTVSKLEVETVCVSTKRIIKFSPLAAYGCTSTCTVGIYQRDITRSLPLGNIEFSLKNPANHIMDGLALVIATKR